jgi:RNA polymerase sigma-70 factor (ECF subfamily)
MPLDRPTSDTPGLTSATLLERLKGRDQDAWRRFVHVYGPLIDGWCRRAGLPPDDVADVCQEVFRRVSTAIGTFRPAGGGAFRGWLRAITRNCAHDHYRRQANAPRAAGGSEALLRLAAVPEVADPVSQEEAAAESVGVVRRALELIRPEFAEQTWLAFTRVALDGEGPAEVANGLKMTAFAVRQANYRVRRRLREELGELFD